jgi:hypothetical protein
MLLALGQRSHAACGTHFPSQGVDWRDPAVQDHACNGELNPLQPGFNDGINVDPLEVMFIKVKAAFLAAGNWPHADAAVKYARWARLAGEEAARRAAGARGASPRWLAAIAANEWPQKRAPALLRDAERRGRDCFDHKFYIDSGGLAPGSVVVGAARGAAGGKAVGGAMGAAAM